MGDVRTYLESQGKDGLVEMLMQQAMEDDILRERLLMKTASRGPKGLDLATFRAAIDNAVDIDDLADHRSAYDYSRGIDEVIDSIENLLKEGHASEVIELAEYGLEVVEYAVGSFHDSDGQMGYILERLQEIHHAACKMAKPDPEKLAERLFEWELRTDWDTFYGAARTYSDVFGKRGLAVYRKLAEAEWEKVPQLRPGQDDPDGYGRRFRITGIMETLEEKSGDTEALVRVKSRDLSRAHRFLQIAEIYKQAQNYDQALEWAEKGVKAFPERTDSRLREFLADEYHRRNRHDEAMTLVWAEFTDSPNAVQYENLKSHSDRYGQWPAWREKALAFLREDIVRAKRKAAEDRWARKTDHSELVKVFLWEKDIDAAWREANEGGCSNDLWLKLAARREKNHPEDALVVYQKQIEPMLAQKNNVAYAEAVVFLHNIRSLMLRLGRGSEFTEYLERVRAAHKPKRNFMKLLDNARWS
jgi:tetratricopeptide (TPR) repeat protein